MSKSSLISTINGYITATVTVAKVRNAYLELINVFYSTVKNELATAGTPNGANTITTTTNPATTYNLDFKKEGNKVFISGTIINDSALALTSGSVLFTFSDASYTLKTGTYQYFDIFNYKGTKGTLRIDGSSVKCFSSLPSGIPFNINLFYYIAD